MKIITVLFILAVMSCPVNGQVTQQWVQKYNGTGNGSDQASGVAIDNSGNVYVTGRSVGAGTSFDYLTIKYNSAGVQQWAARYDGPESGSDEASAIAVDNAGNVYVTGMSGSTGAGGIMYADYLTIKYSSNGNPVWTQRYNGPGNAGDGANALVIDASGNVYVTGLSSSSGSSAFDYATIKYSTGGSEEWVSRYTGPGSVSEAKAIAVDAQGNVYVTGKSNGGSSFNDYATIKYTSSGTQQWVQRFNGPSNNFDEASAIAVGDSGNVYVTGRSFGSGVSYDYATIKYNSSGVPQWNMRYNGPADGEDNARIIILDSANNVYVTGGSTGAVGQDYATIKYNSAGSQQWAKRYARGLATAIALDGSGNIYISGTATGTGTGSDYATIKYNPAGVQQWVKRYTGPGNNSDQVNSIAVDNSGNVFITGYSMESNDDYATIKYSPDNSTTINISREGLNKPINDNQNTFDTIAVTNDLSSGYILDVNLVLDTILHPNDADLEISLIHAGITDTVVYRHGGSGDNFINTVFDDSEGTNISAGTAPFTGSFTPFKTLSQFVNLDPAGSWVLRVFDRTTGNTGALKGWGLVISVSATPIGISNTSNQIPENFHLSQNYPNPFNPMTKIKFDIPKAFNTKLAVYDILGKEVAVLVNGNLKAGSYEVDFSAADLPSGTYFYRITTEGFTETKKMMLLK